MSQKDELAKIKARIRVLAVRTTSNGCTEAEAMAAADMVGKLLSSYALTMDEVDVREEPCVQVKVPFGSVKRGPIDNCIVAISRFCDVMMWVSRESSASGTLGAGFYTFFGFEADTQMACYLHDVIRWAITTESWTFRSEQRRRTPSAARLKAATDSFHHGMGARISGRLNEMKAEQEEIIRRQRAALESANSGSPSGGTALVVLKAKVIDEAFKKTGIGLVSSRSSGPGIRDRDAFRSGMAAGDKVKLTRPAGDGLKALT